MGKAVKLEITDDFNFPLIGIVTTEPIYRLGFLINEMLGYNLKESRSLKVYHAKHQLVQEFPLFSEYADDCCAVVHLIQNKSLQGLFIEDQKQVDFWLKWEHILIDTDRVLAMLKKIKNINLAFEVKPGSLKSKSRLLFTIEQQD
ncbi:MAG: IPExxxVDY family protein [Salinivirgaceae bacterium]